MYLCAWASILFPSYSSFAVVESEVTRYSTYNIYREMFSYTTFGTILHPWKWQNFLEAAKSSYILIGLQEQEKYKKEAKFPWANSAVILWTLHCVFIVYWKFTTIVESIKKCKNIHSAGSFTFTKIFTKNFSMIHHSFRLQPDALLIPIHLTCHAWMKNRLFWLKITVVHIPIEYDN